ncbi:hypothetical protein BDR04DRAFT_1140112 [Suillus decipiens]|nr:hypothetical protein BDR04DRAFT_1140112 [Suillus decipiens]
MVPLFDQADISIGIILQHTNCALFATACLWFYDFALTLDKEVAFILYAPWRIPKLTYLVCRCLPFASIVSYMLRTISKQDFQSCATLFAFNSYVKGIVLFCAESLFMQRVRAITGPRWLIMCCNIAIILVPLAVILTLGNSFSTITQSPIPQVASCYDSEQGRIVVFAYVLLVIGEIEILAFMLYHSWKLYRWEYGNDLPLVRVLVRHNISYFICGLLSSIMVVAIMFTLPASYGDVASESQFMIHGILATRMHRELYNTAHRTEESSTGNVTLPLVFAPASLDM